jgi:hypothetical protein
MQQNSGMANLFRLTGLRPIGLPLLYSPHSFRVTTITDLLKQGIPLEDVQRLAWHADPRTTGLYDGGSGRSRAI